MTEIYRLSQVRLQACVTLNFLDTSWTAFSYKPLFYNRFLFGFSMEIKDRCLNDISTNADRLKKLGVYLNQLDECQRISARPDKERIRRIQSGIENIVEKLASRIATKRPIFRGTIENMGSYYDGLKVGAPDEFDFMLVLEEFTKDNGLHSLLLTRRPPGFAAIRVHGEKHSSEWPITEYCPVHESLVVVKKKILHRCYSRSIVKVLDPLRIQDEYRKAADEEMPSIELPPNWCHGGCNRPYFSGHRKHGPATLFQFIYADEQGEIKVTIDLTLAIRLQIGVDLHIHDMHMLKRFPLGNEHFEKFLEYLQTDPGMHIIPLYSKFLIEEGYGGKKYNWKVSGSCSEKIIFQSMQEDSLMKKTIRVLKILRDTYLTYFRRKTERKKKKRTIKTKNKDNNQSQRNHAPESDTTDFTEVEYFGEEATSKFNRIKARIYQSKDIGFHPRNPEPGSGEYWGARHYIASVEIKTFALSLLFGEYILYKLDGSLIDYTGPTDDETLALLVLIGVDHFKNMFLGSQQTEYIYFKTALCSPLSSQKVQDALVAIDKIIKHLDENSKIKTI